MATVEDAPLPGPLSALPPPARAPLATVRRQAARLCSGPLGAALLEGADGLVLVLDPRRQILASNAREAAALVGLRAGEALRCVVALGSAAGCEASEECLACALLRAVAGGERRPVAGDLSLVVDDAGVPRPLDLTVRAVPVALDECSCVVVSLRDAGARKTREALETAFLHDLGNSIRALGYLCDAIDRDGARAAAPLRPLVSSLERELSAHRALLRAARGAPAPVVATVEAAQLLDDLGARFAADPVARDRAFEVPPPARRVTLATDATLLARVLDNMVRNAFEATPPGGTVRLWCDEPGGDDAGRCAFHVWNREEIPAHVAARIFQRSFTTKDHPGRGLGTWAMKLLGEGALGGRVSFTTSAASGTVFTIALPLRD